METAVNKDLSEHGQTWRTRKSCIFALGMLKPNR